MINLLKMLLKIVQYWFSSRNQLVLVILLLRHQISILQRNAKRPRLKRSDRVIFVLISRILKNWKQTISIVKPDTVLRWHRKGFKLFWRWKSVSGKSGRKPIDPDTRKLIREMSSANHHWGAPRIHGELLKLGINISQATVRRYMVKHRKPPSQTWKTFLENHAKELVAIDFFVVPISYLSNALCFHRPFTFAQKNHSFQCNSITNICVGWSTNYRSLPMGYGTEISDTR